MKTAISIPDPIFKSAEQTAKRLGLSRSQLFTRAVTAFVEEHSPQEITRALDRVYAGEPSALEKGWKVLQGKALKRAVW